MKAKQSESPWVRRNREAARAEAERVARYRETRLMALRCMRPEDPLYGFVKWTAEHGYPR